MKKNKLLISSLGGLMLFSLLFVGGCSLGNLTKNSRENDKIKVAATIFPLYDLVKEVAGDKIEAILVLPPGASPHTFEVTPQQVKSLQDSKILFTIGANLDNWALNLANAIDGVGLVDMSLAVELRPFSLDEHEDEIIDDDEKLEGEDDGHNQGNLDPHYWLSFKQAKLMVNKITDELIALDKNNKEYYLANANNYLRELESKIPVWEERIASLANRNIIVFHDAWSYFATDFNLQIVATFEPYPGKSPTPKYLQTINEKVEKYQVNKLYIEPQLSVEIAKTLAQDLNLEIRILDPLGGINERDSYLNLIDYNINEVTR